MIENGIVIEIKVAKATVALPPKKSCGGCGKCALGKEGKAMKITAENPVGAEKGDRVAVEIPFRDPLLGAFILFGLPLLGLLGGAALGYLLFPTDKPAGNLAAVALGLAGLTAVFLFVRGNEKNREQKTENRVRIVGILPGRPETDRTG